MLGRQFMFCCWYLLLLWLKSHAVCCASFLVIFLLFGFVIFYSDWIDFAQWKSSIRKIRMCNEVTTKFFSLIRFTSYWSWLPFDIESIGGRRTSSFSFEVWVSVRVMALIPSVGKEQLLKKFQTRKNCPSKSGVFRLEWRWCNLSLSWTNDWNVLHNSYLRWILCVL